jgi:hypothetical protein
MRGVGILGITCDHIAADAIAGWALLAQAVNLALQQLANADLKFELVSGGLIRTSLPGDDRVRRVWEYLPRLGRRGSVVMTAVENKALVS